MLQAIEISEREGNPRLPITTLIEIAGDYSLCLSTDIQFCQSTRFSWIDKGMSPLSSGPSAYTSKYGAICRGTVSTMGHHSVTVNQTKCMRLDPNYSQKITIARHRAYLKAKDRVDLPSRWAIIDAYVMYYADKCCFNIPDSSYLDKLKDIDHNAESIDHDT